MEEKSTLNIEEEKNNESEQTSKTAKATDVLSGQTAWASGSTSDNNNTESAGYGQNKEKDFEKEDMPEETETEKEKEEALFQQQKTEKEAIIQKITEEKKERELKEEIREEEQRKKENLLLSLFKSVLQAFVKIVETISDQIAFLSLSRHTKDVIAQEAIVSRKMAENQKEKKQEKNQENPEFEKGREMGEKEKEPERETERKKETNKESEKEKISETEQKKENAKTPDPLESLTNEEAKEKFENLKEEYSKNPYLMPLENMEEMLKIAAMYNLGIKFNCINLTVGDKKYNMWCKQFENGHVAIGYKNVTDNQKITKEEFEKARENGDKIYYNATWKESPQSFYPVYYLSLKQAERELNNIMENKLAPGKDAERYKEVAQKATEEKDLEKMTKLIEYAKSTEDRYLNQLQKKYESLNQVSLPNQCAELFAIQKRMEINEELNLGLEMNAEKNIIKEAFEPGTPQKIGELMNMQYLDFNKMAEIGLKMQENEIIFANAADGIEYPADVTLLLNEKMEEKKFEDVARILCGFAVYPAENTDAAKGYVQNFIDYIGQNSPQIGDNKYNVGLATCHLNYLNTLENMKEEIRTPEMDAFVEKEKKTFLERNAEEYAKGIGETEKQVFQSINNGCDYDDIIAAMSQETGFIMNVPELVVQQNPVTVQIPEPEYNEEEIEAVAKAAKEMYESQDLDQYEQEISDFDKHIAQYTEMVNEMAGTEEREKEEERER